MKRLMVILLTIFFALNITACKSIENDNDSTIQTNISETVNVAKKISSSDVLKITKEMSCKEIMDLLGETLYSNAYKGWFLYIIDDMQYLQLFSDINFIPGQSGEEILETIKKQNTEIKPSFIDPEEAAVMMKPNPLTAFPLKIYYAGQDYVYAAYDLGAEFTFRYNIEKNKVDRVLNCSSFDINDWTNPMSLHIGQNFFLDGYHDIIYAATTGELEYSLEYRNSFPIEYIYIADFENESVTLFSNGSDDTKFPTNEELYSVNEEDYEVMMDKYSEMVKLNPSLPEMRDWSAFAQIDEKRICVFEQIQNESSNPEQCAFKFSVVDINQIKVIQEYTFG